MSKYSGKCDFGDSWEIWGEDHVLNSKIYIGDNIIPLKIETYKDALPYFPRIVFLAAGDKGSSVIRLTEESFVDLRESERLNWVLEDVKRYYRKCKRSKKTFDFDEAMRLVCWFGSDIEIYEPIVREVMRKGDKAQVPDKVHIPYYDYERKFLYDDMVEAGYSEQEAAIWCFGFTRWINDDLPNGVIGRKANADD